MRTLAACRKQLHSGNSRDLESPRSGKFFLMVVAKQLLGALLPPYEPEGGELAGLNVTSKEKQAWRRTDVVCSVVSEKLKEEKTMDVVMAEKHGWKGVGNELLL